MGDRRDDDSPRTLKTQKPTVFSETPKSQEKEKEEDKEKEKDAPHRRRPLEAAVRRRGEKR